MMNIVSGSKTPGWSALWHIRVPEAILRTNACTRGHAYFSDRSYYAFVKNHEFVSFMHGIDRYAIFQKGAQNIFDFFYPHQQPFAWHAEIPFGTNLNCEAIDIITLNRTTKDAEITIEFRDKDGATLKKDSRKIPHRGIYVYRVEKSFLNAIGENGSFAMKGLPTRWSRMVILRHFANGSIAAMHC